MIGPIPKRPMGTSAKARFYQWVYDSITRGLQVQFGSGLKVSQTVQGQRVELSQEIGASGSGRVSQYILTDHSQDDYFICRAFALSTDNSDPENPLVVATIGQTDVFIAKPYELRRSPFDREVLNADEPELIGTVDENTVDTVKETWNGTSLDTITESWSHDYKSATFRITTNATDEDPDNWTTQKQTIIPRFIDAVLSEPDEDGKQTLENAGATLIYAKRCSGMNIVDEDENPITLLAESDGRAWAKTS